MGIDRTDYGNRLREANKEQLLLNIVAMRYGDAPLFLEVSSVISQYSREANVGVDLTLAPPSGSSDGGVAGGVVIRETPTVTYTPLSGDRFARSLLSPLPPASLLSMMESGWSAEILFPLAVRSVNGLRNGSRDPLFAEVGDGEFPLVVAALARLQRSRGLVLNIERHEANNFHAHGQIGENLSPQDQKDIAFLVRALKLPDDRMETFELVFAAAKSDPDQLAIRTRSMFEIFSELAQGVDAPVLEKGGTPLDPGAATEHVAPLLRVRSGAAPPSDAHAAVRFRGRWFWIDGDDAASKRTFLVAQILLSLADTSGAAAGPLVTVPVN
ncbi:hypothetical protein GGC65_003150 [Sphingopyxis sp. OAS728]|uniref:hypothetical protein n=1 Tax=Sphingopyxis sp. OAS728 TaxID=2663823 RepID=UPI001789166D|nr:hypothetical protein [Sphingopyxis sp. OAS728]MBE1528694.1 hypothetical protein [Sphingopyxis sp. OAS728]